MPCDFGPRPSFVRRLPVPGQAWHAFTIRRTSSRLNGWPAPALPLSVGRVHVDFRRSGRRVAVLVHRDDGVLLETTTSTPKGALLPHDLEHFVVENAVGLTSGLWGRIAAGAEFTSFTVLTQKPRRRSRAYGRSLTRGMSGWDENIIGIATACYRSAVAMGWAPPRKLPGNLPIDRALARVAGSVERDLTRDDVENVCAALHYTIEAWNAVSEGEVLTQRWTVRKPFVPSSKRPH